MAGRGSRRDEIIAKLLEELQLEGIADEHIDESAIPLLLAQAHVTESKHPAAVPNPAMTVDAKAIQWLRTILERFRKHGRYPSEQEAKDFQWYCSLLMTVLHQEYHVAPRSAFYAAVLVWLNALDTPDVSISQLFQRHPSLDTEYVTSGVFHLEPQTLSLARIYLEETSRPRWLPMPRGEGQ